MIKEMKKKKWTWWKILLIIVFSPFAVLYFGGKYLFKFYKSDRFTTKQKAVYTVIGVCVLAFISVIVDMNKGPELKKVEIADITLYKGKSQKVKMTLTPKDSNAMDTSFTGYDSNIVEVKKVLQNVNEFQQVANIYSKKNKKSFALVQNITTISKIRIKKPVNHYDPIKKLIADSLILDLIDNKIIELFTNNPK